MNVAVLGSTKGTSLQPIIDAKSEGRLPHVVLGPIISNDPDAYILTRAQQAGLPNYCVKSESRSRDEFEKKLIDLLETQRVDMILLIGFMRILTPTFLHKYQGKVINVHPSLLPAFAGGMDIDVHQAVIDAGVVETGCTLHLVDEGIDTGEVIMQKKCPVLVEDTAMTLKKKVQALEGQAFVELLSSPKTYLKKQQAQQIRRALISVSNKDGIVEFARTLVERGIDIISTGGTAKILREHNIHVTEAADVTNFPEMMQGRVKTLHPAIHGGILGKRDEHKEDAQANNIEWIDLVICNLYPFADVVSNPNASRSEVIEHIDIGGPSMIRSAAKNVDWVSVVIDPSDYEELGAQISNTGTISHETRNMLQAKAFAHTAWYDSMISQYFSHQQTQHLSFPLSLFDTPRYGENPHQVAQVFRSDGFSPSLLDAKVHQGKKLSYNNYLDSDAAIRIVRSFSDPTAVVVKHANPCGVASHADIDEAFRRAYAADHRSAFGGIISLNRACTSGIAQQINSVFAEVIIAPSFTQEAREVLAKKKNLRVVEFGPVTTMDTSRKEFRSILGGVLVQDADTKQLDPASLTIPTRRHSTKRELDDLLFAWSVIAHAKSNAILICKDKATVGLGAGQVSRVDATYLSIRKAQLSLVDFNAAIAFDIQLDGCVLASDAFLPFRDNIDAIAKAGIQAIIQPGGSVRDPEVIKACDEYDIAMVFTGARSFRH